MENKDIKHVALEDLEESYIVTICGYEGIEQMYGTFNRKDALELALDLKSKRSNKAKSIMKRYKPEQVCIQAAPEKIFRGWNKEKTEVLLKQNSLKEMSCCCKDFPELPKNKEPWIMG
jgi:hypothetical protein